MAFKCKRDIDPLPEACDTEICNLVDDAKAVLVIDGNGDVTPFRLSNANVAQRLSENELPLKVAAIGRIDCYSVAQVTPREGGCTLITSYGDYLYLC